MKRLLFILLPALLQYNITNSQSRPEEIYHIDSRLELFTDSFIIESIRNLDLRMHSPVDEGVVLKFDNPWEGPFSAYTTVIKDGNTFRLYYRGLATTKGEATNEEVTCYAESKNGRDWFKPDLKLYRINNTINNNVVFAKEKPFSHNFSPFIDKNPDSVNGKFKALAGLAEGLFAFVSDDGIHWKKLNDKPVLSGEQFDSQNIAFWSESEKCYICYFRKWKEYNSKLIRSVGRSTSVDFMNWTKPVLVDFGDAPVEELYINQTSPYYRAPHIYISLAARFFPGKQIITDDQARLLNVNPSYFKDCSDAVLFTSRGGNTFQRIFREGFLRPGIGLSNWISRTNYPALNIVQTGETEMSFYVNQDYAQPTAHLRRYSIRIDGLASVHASYRPGEMTTRPMIFNGLNLILNFGTSADGYVLVELLDHHGNPIPEFTFDECTPLIGNEISRNVMWKTKKSLTELENKTIRIHFKLKDADLYSFKFE